MKSSGKTVLNAKDVKKVVDEINVLFDSWLQMSGKSESDFKKLAVYDDLTICYNNVEGNKVFALGRYHKGADFVLLMEPVVLAGKDAFPDMALLFLSAAAKLDEEGSKIKGMFKRADDHYTEKFRKLIADFEKSL